MQHAFETVSTIIITITIITIALTLWGKRNVTTEREDIPMVFLPPPPRCVWEDEAKYEEAIATCKRVERQMMVLEHKVQVFRASQEAPVIEEEEEEYDFPLPARPMKTRFRMPENRRNRKVRTRNRTAERTCKVCNQ